MCQVGKPLRNLLFVSFFVRSSTVHDGSASCGPDCTGVCYAGRCLPTTSLDGDEGGRLPQLAESTLLGEPANTKPSYRSNSGYLSKLSPGWTQNRSEVVEQQWKAAKLYTPQNDERPDDSLVLEVQGGTSDPQVQMDVAVVTAQELDALGEEMQPENESLLDAHDKSKDLNIWEDEVGSDAPEGKTILPADEQDQLLTALGESADEQDQLLFDLGDELQRIDDALPAVPMKAMHLDVPQVSTASHAEQSVAVVTAQGLDAVEDEQSADVALLGMNDRSWSALLDEQNSTAWDERHTAVLAGQEVETRSILEHALNDENKALRQELGLWRNAGQVISERENKILEHLTQQQQDLIPFEQDLESPTAVDNPKFITGVSRRIDYSHHEVALFIGLGTLLLGVLVLGFVVLRQGHGKRNCSCSMCFVPVEITDIEIEHLNNVKVVHILIRVNGADYHVHQVGYGGSHVSKVDKVVQVQMPRMQIGSTPVVEMIISSDSQEDRRIEATFQLQGHEISELLSAANWDDERHFYQFNVHGEALKDWCEPTVSVSMNIKHGFTVKAEKKNVGFQDLPRERSRDEESDLRKEDKKLKHIQFPSSESEQEEEDMAPRRRQNPSFARPWAEPYRAPMDSPKTRHVVRTSSLGFMRDMSPGGNPPGNAVKFET